MVGNDDIGRVLRFFLFSIVVIIFIVILIALLILNLFALVNNIEISQLIVVIGDGSLAPVRLESEQLSTQLQSDPPLKRIYQ
jgi:hypothetical protein